MTSKAKAAGRVHRQQKKHNQNNADMARWGNTLNTPLGRTIGVGSLDALADVESFTKRLT